jgi:hypothetical protein
MLKGTDNLQGIGIGGCLIVKYIVETLNGIV